MVGCSFERLNEELMLVEATQSRQVDDDSTDRTR